MKQINPVDFSIGFSTRDKNIVEFTVSWQCDLLTDQETRYEVGADDMVETQSVGLQRR
jgi:hypothetical protein